MTDTDTITAAISSINQSDREAEECQLAFALGDGDAYIQRKVQEYRERLNAKYSELRSTSNGRDSGADSGGDSVDVSVANVGPEGHGD